MEKKQKIEIAITAILVLALFFAWKNTFKAVRQRGTGKVSPSISAIKAAPTSPLATPVGKNEKEVPPEQLEWVRDPFSGKAYSSVDSGAISLKLEGIIWDKENPVAMINDRILKAGDRIASYQVVRIKPDRVILSDGTRDFELKL